MGRQAVRERRPRALEQFKVARTLASQGALAEAAERYVAALAIDPEFSEALINLGIVYGQLGPDRAAEAVRCLERAVKLAPTSARAHYNLGVALSRRRVTIDRAITEFDAALAIDPAHRNALYALAVQWNRKGDPVRASVFHQRYQASMSAGLRAAPSDDSRASLKQVRRVEESFRRSGLPRPPEVAPQAAVLTATREGISAGLLRAGPALNGASIPAGQPPARGPLLRLRFRRSWGT